MSNIPEHCKVSLERFGKEFREVHEWLDFYYRGKYIDENGKEHDYTGDYSQIRHREVRHHWEGIAECVREFQGQFDEDVVRKVAESHIIDDFKDHPNPEYRGRVLSKDEYPTVFWKER